MGNQLQWCLSAARSLLLLAGDVETNPGPPRGKKRGRPATNSTRITRSSAARGKEQICEPVAKKPRKCAKPRRKTAANKARVNRKKKSISKKKNPKSPKNHWTEIDQRINDIAIKEGIEPSVLDTACARGHLLPISKVLVHWNTYAQHLGLSALELNHIQTNQDLTAAHQKPLEMLMVWQRKHASSPKSHYRHLLRGCIEINEDAALVGNVCKLIATNPREADEEQTVDLSHLSASLHQQIDVNKIQAFYDNAKAISMLLTGKTGSGKSTLVNGILGLKVKDKGAAEEGTSIKKACTSEVKPYTKEKKGIQVTVWDTPGLQDGTENDEKYLKEIKQKCSETDLALYCIKVLETRCICEPNNSDLRAMKKLTEKFGVEFWKSVVIVFTFSNSLESCKIEWMDLSVEEKAEEFRKVIQEWKDQVKEILISHAKVPQVIVDDIHMIPVGHYRIPNLPDREYWLSVLWYQCLNAIQSPESQAALVKINVERMTHKKDVKEADFKKEPEDQPIVYADSSDNKFWGPVIKSAAIGIPVGAAVFLSPLGIFAAVPAGIVAGLGARYVFMK